MSSRSRPYRRFHESPQDGYRYRNITVGLERADYDLLSLEADDINLSNSEFLRRVVRLAFLQPDLIKKAKNVDIWV